MADQGQSQTTPATGSQQPARSGQSASSSAWDTQRLPAAPAAPDALTGAAAHAANAPAADVWQPDADDTFGDDRLDHLGESALSQVESVRARARRQIREFLRAVPRTEVEATLAIVRPDGTARVFTRGELTTAIDRLRPRMRQIIRLAVEERWLRSQVCAYLQHISIKTFERDQVEALDLLMQL
jgi:hypothetical protein